MNRGLDKALTDCISRIERGAGLEECLEAHPSLAGELRPHLETWQAMGTDSLAQPSASAFDQGRRAMLSALESAPVTFSPLSAARLPTAWLTVAAAVAAFMVLIGGAAGASAALGGPDPAGDVLSVVGVNSSDGAHGGIGQSSASDRGRECANPNAFEGSANSEDKGQNADDAHQKQSCSQGADEGAAADQSSDACEDANNGNGNDADHDDAGNPGQGKGDNGANSDSANGDCPTAQQGEDANNGHGNDTDHDDSSNPGQGQGNHGTNNGSNAGGDAN